MVKRILSLALMLLMLMNLIGNIQVYAFEGTEEYYSYEVLDGKATITDVYYSNYGDMIVPAVLGGCPVTNIEDGAFFGVFADSISFPDSITSIGDLAFQSCYTKSYVIGENNKVYCTVDGNLFSKDKKKIVQYAIGKEDKAYTIPDGVTDIGKYAFHGSKLMSIDIPDSVNNIDTGAFYYCDGITNFTIPGNVSNIGDFAFYSCDGLISVEIEDGVKTIGASAFENCDNLASVKIPDSVTDIGRASFKFCGSILDITIPESVTSIAEWMFCGCESLKTITIPHSVTSVEALAFYDCYQLTDVFYCGTQEDWGKISISNKNNTNLMYATIHYNYVPIAYNPPETKLNESFNFASGNGKGTFDYDDNYFQDTSYKYNHDLARLSIRVAMAAFGKVEKKGTYFGNAYVNIEEMMKKMGFDENSIYHNDWYEKKPTANSIGVAIGKKHIAYPDDDYTLIAVAIRGGGYKSEWGGNFNVGTEKHHAGFAEARDQVISEIQKYINRNIISGKIKIWITGYSRAAATANLTAAYIDENLQAIGTGVMLTPKDVYAYCFETPAGVVNPASATGLYDNIFSVVNQHDFVPMVAMRKWGFGRYGITKYLPIPQTKGDEYAVLLDAMKKNFEKYRDEEYIIDGFIEYYPTTAWITEIETGNLNGQGLFLDRLIDSVADTIGSTQEYTEHFQDAFMYIGEKIIGQGIYQELAQSFLDELEERGVLFAVEIGTGLLWYMKPLSDKALYSSIRASIIDAFENVGVSVDKEMVDKLVELLINIGLDRIVTIANNLENLAQAHKPEVCMAWLDVIDEHDFSKKRMRTFYLNCPVDVEVYDSTGKLVAAINDNVPQKIEGSSIVCYIDVNGQKVVYLPTDEEYRVEVIATDDGEVTYTVQEQDAESGTTKVINYNKIAVKKNDTLTGTVENLNETEVATYALASVSVDITEPEIIGNATPVAVTPVAEGNGSVSGGGTLFKGEYAQLSAIPLKNEEFLGWYNGEILVSADAMYRFQVEETITLTARFTENTCEIAFLSQDEDVVVIERILKGNKITFPTVNQNENYVIEAVYTDKELLNIADENATYSADSILYLDCAHRRNWVQFDEENNDIVVYSPKNIENVLALVALYKEGKFLGVKSIPINISEAKTIYDSPITDYSKADTVKVMILENISNLKPLFMNSVTELE